MAGRARSLHTITKRRQLHDRQARARSYLATPARNQGVINSRDLLVDRIDVDHILSTLPVAARPGSSDTSTCSWPSDRLFGRR